MSRVDSLIIEAKVRSQLAVAGAKDAVKSMVSKKPGDSQIVVALVLIAVAVGLCFIFKDSIRTIINQIALAVENAITKLTADTTTG